MKDWKAIAKAEKLDIPEGDLERITPPLDGLEQAFRPLLQTLAGETQPAAIFRPLEEGE